MRGNLVMAGALLAALGSPAAADIKMPLPNGPYAFLPFSDVPGSHPAYAAGDYLGSLGLPSARMHPYSKRPITRYEFAVFVQRVLGALRRTVGAAPTEKPYGGDEAVLRRTVADPQRLGEALNWLTPMIHEFAPELRLVGDDAERRLREVNQWRREAPQLARRAQETRARLSPASVEVGAARGPFADLSETHSLTHPCYASADYVSNLLGRGQLVDTMNVSSNLAAVDRSRANIAWLRALTDEYRAERKLFGKKSRLEAESPEGAR